MDVGIDSLQVERGTAEDSSMILHSPLISLTSPTRRASQFFKFLSEGGSPQGLIHASDQLPSPHGSHLLETVIQSTVEDDKTTRAILYVRDGPKEGHARVSPAPRRHLPTAPANPLPTQPHHHTINKVLPSKPSPLGHRIPFDELRNGEGSDSHVVPRNVSSRSVSVASSVYPHIERSELGMDSDPYTPVPPRRTVEGRRGRHSMVGENIPPNAPARAARRQPRKSISRDCHCPRPARRKENSQNISSKIPSIEQNTSTLTHLCKNGVLNCDLQFHVY